MASGDKFYLGSGGKSYADYFTYDQSVGITEVVVNLPYEISVFNYIANDDLQNDLLIAFNNETTSGELSGKNKVIKLKAGEIINELNVKATIIKFKRAAGTGNVRFVGV